MSDKIFDEINFSEVDIDPPVIEGDKISIKMHNISLVSDDYSTEFIGSAFLIFNGVAKSIRTVDEYAGDPKVDGFKEGYTKEDISCDNDNLDGKKEYEFEGVLTNPLAWVGSWIIYCDSVEFKKIDKIKKKRKWSNLLFNN